MLPSQVGTSAITTYLSAATAQAPKAAAALTNATSQSAVAAVGSSLAALLSRCAVMCGMCTPLFRTHTCCCGAALYSGAAGPNTQNPVQAGLARQFMAHPNCADRMC